MTKAKRRINKFNFQNDDAHVALVDSAANGQEVLVMKSARASEEEIKKALDKDVTVKLTIMEFLTRYLGLWWDEAEIVAGMLGYTAEDIYTFEDSAVDFVQYVQDQMDSVEITKSKHHEKLRGAINDFVEKYISEESSSSVKEGDEEDNSQTEDNEGATKPMSKAEDNSEMETSVEPTEETNKSTEESVSKSTLRDYEERLQKQAEQLEALQKERGARRHAEFLEKAEKVKPHLGDDFDTEQLAKAMDAAEGSETINLLVKAVEALSDTKDKSGLLEEVGKSATQEQALDSEDQVEKIQKELMASENISAAKAYVRAWERVNEA